MPELKRFYCFDCFPKLRTSNKYLPKFRVTSSAGSFSNSHLPSCICIHALVFMYLQLFICMCVSVGMAMRMRKGRVCEQCGAFITLHPTYVGYVGYSVSMRIAKNRLMAIPSCIYVFEVVHFYLCICMMMMMIMTMMMMKIINQ